MSLGAGDLSRGLESLRAAVLQALALEPSLAAAGTTAGPGSGRPPSYLLMSEAASGQDLRAPGSGGYGDGGYGDSGLAASSEEDEADRERLIALVELARAGDKEAFGLLFDHYHPSVYRFIYYRTRSQVLAEDLASETFFRALRSMNNFRWQGKDFGAWLMTIARNLTTDHFKAGRTRLEQATEDMGVHDDTTEGPETTVLAALTNEVLLTSLQKLPKEQQECLIMRFLQSMSIAETAQVLGRSEGAVKQLQLRGVRNLAKLMPAGVRD
jgi:RNA polymerase sigma-70 factor (ECF subfamily)